ncbi:MAG: FAD-binding oxidoreductase, partial [Bacteroidota bacterium]
MKKTFVHNWGNYPVIEADVHSPSFEQDIQAMVQSQETLLARGNGRCYGDAALNPTLFSTHKLNKLLAFDREKGILTCESGVILSDILDVIVPAGFFLPVTPGTKFISIGGAIAADVHGKNHHAEGCFSDHLLSFDLVNAAGQIVRCTKEDTPELFWQTVGGMGLTGIIIRATFNLKPIETAFIRQESIKAQNLQEIMDLFEESESWTYTMSWIDCLQKGKNIGRSILMRGEHALPNEIPAKASSAPLDLPKKGKL